MSEANREILSAGMDGELSREEIRFLLRRLEADPVLADTWARFHVGRDGLRGDVTPLVSMDFASRVMAAMMQMMNIDIAKLEEAAAAA